MSDQPSPVHYARLADRHLTSVLAGMEARVREAGLTLAQYHLLLTLKAHRREPPSVGAVVAQMQITHAKLVGR